MLYLRSSLKSILQISSRKLLLLNTNECSFKLPGCSCNCNEGSKLVSKKFHTSLRTFKQRQDKKFVKLKEPEPKVFSIWNDMTVQEISQEVNRTLDDIFEIMLFVPKADEFDRPSSKITDIKITREIVKKLGYRSIVIPRPDLKKAKEKPQLGFKPAPVNSALLALRPPVVTIMGHVDHGKTTLLDSIRNSSVAAGEAGGITQSIGAFRVQVRDSYITFIDTPGHAAFSAMRNRGAQATDMVVLVVAADDGVMEQTRESISMAQGANVPIIVAINKIDRGGADIERSKRMLLQEGIQLEEFGGDVQAVPISALKQTNIPALLDAILTQAEIMGLQSEASGPIEGIILESQVDSKRGKSAAAVIQRGLLKKNAFVIAGEAWAKVRSFQDENGNVMSQASPSTPCEIFGWKDLPSAGDKLYEVPNEKMAKGIVEERISERMREKQENDSEVIELKKSEHLKGYKAALEAKQKLGRRKVRRVGPRPKEIPDDDRLRLHIIIKGDVDGSVESLLDVIDTYGAVDQCHLDVAHFGVGEVTESDVKLAETFNGIIYGFNVGMSPAIEADCVKRKVKFRSSKIIYRLVEYLKKDLEELLPPLDEEEALGEGNVLQIFEINEGKKKVPVAGTRCTKGSLRKDSHIRVIRDEETVFEGRVASMRHLKDEVESVRKGMECGIQIDGLTIELKAGDTLQAYKFVPKAQTIRWEPTGF